MGEKPSGAVDAGRGARITNLVVGGIFALGLIALAVTLAGWRGGAFLTALVLYEGWTLVNRYRGDTISEAVWRFARRPLVPLACGGVAGYVIAAKYVTDPILIVVMGLMAGHLFFGRGTAEDNARGEPD